MPSLFGNGGWVGGLPRAAEIYRRTELIVTLIEKSQNTEVQ
jgi:hypothetical protein